MRFKPESALTEAENNIYQGVDLLKGTIVFVWALLCPFVINKSKSLLWATALGIVYYLSLVVLCTVSFKGMDKYLSFPKENKKMPVFIGHKLDSLFVYPIMLMSIMGIISRLLTAAGLYPANPMQIPGIENRLIELIARITLLPLVAFSEEMFNLLLVSVFYVKLKQLGSFRLAGSILVSALVFGLLHSSGWGLQTSIAIGIAYLPVFFVTLYTGNIWISFLAHLYNDIIVLTKAYYGSYFIIVIAVISCVPAGWAIVKLLKRSR